MNAPLPSGQLARLPVEALTLAAPRDTYAYWTRKRGGRAMPQPDDFDPIEIPRLLPVLSFIDVLDETPVDYFYRIEGERIREAMGHRRMGYRLSALANLYEKAYGLTRALFEEIRLTHQLIAGRTSLSLIGRGYHRLEMLLLPLSRDGEAVHRLVMCLDFLALPRDPASAIPPGEPLGSLL